METRVESIMLWGHSLDEYIQMFDLTEADLSKSILDCTAAAGSFNTEMTKKGHNVISCDGMYDRSADDLRSELTQAHHKLLAEIKDNEHKFRWQRVQSPEALAKAWEQSADQFLADYEAGRKEGRYVQAKPPQLGFKDHQFDLALCSHFLFNKYFHKDIDQFLFDAVVELCRVAHEVRIFPLLDVKGEISKMIGPLMLHLQQNDYGVEIREVKYEFQKGGNAMMRVWANTCDVK